MLIPSYFPLVGGSEVQLHGLAGKLAAAGFKIFILTRRLQDTPAFEDKDGVQIIRKRALFKPASFFFSSLAFLIRNRDRFDIIHVHSFDSPALTGAIIKKLFPDKKFILLIPRYGPGSAFTRQERSRLGRIRLRFVLDKADAVIPLSPDAVTAMRRMGIPQEKNADIPNGVDTETFAPVPEEQKREKRKSLRIPEESFIGVTVGRLIKRKNVMGILQAWKSFIAKYPNAVLVVAGGGEEEENLGRYSEYFLPEGSVRFLGPVSRKTIPDLLKAADVYLSFSESEGMSNSMLEALSSGLPIIAARGPGIDQLIEDGLNGFLVEPSDPGSAVASLESLAGDDRKRLEMSRAARKWIEENHSFDIIASRIARLYLGKRDSADCTEPELHTSIPEESSSEADRVEIPT